MRVLVYPHTLEVGGSQLNAIEIAAAVRDRGHYVLMVGRPGPLVETIERLGLPFIALDPRSQRRPSPRAAVHLTRLVRDHKIDVVHGYEWPPTMDAFGGPQLRLGVPVVSTIMSGGVAPFLPRTIPLILGTETTRCPDRAKRVPVALLEPPVDVRANAPSYDPGSWRSDFGLADDIPLVAVVGRIVKESKLEGLLSACDAVGELSATNVSVQLAIVGDGYCRPEVERAAEAANARAGRRAVTLTGEIFDPRPAYASADIVLGMGHSALRTMAFSKPLVVQGEGGFWELLTPESTPMFLRDGFFGRGPDGRVAGAARLTGLLRDLLARPESWPGLGAYGRELVIKRYSLDHAAELQEDIYAAAIKRQRRPSSAYLARESARSAAGVVRHQLRRKWQRRFGTVAVDDFNAAPASAASGGHK